MIEIAICDDEEFFRLDIEKTIFKYFINKKIEYKIKGYETGEELLEDIDRFDLVILDYDFKGKGTDGLKIAKNIREKRLDVVIVFMTSCAEIVYDVFEVSAFRFLLKPVKEEKLFAMFDSFLETLNDEETISVKQCGITYYVKESQISYVEADNKNAVIHFITSRPPIRCNETLSSVEKRIKKNFFRCHKSFLVNMKYVDSYSRTDLVLQNKDVIMISRPKFKAFCRAYGEYISSV